MKQIIKAHQFFVKQSKTYVNLREWKTLRYYPIAYIKFMWFSLGDILRGFKLQDIDTGA